MKLQSVCWRNNFLLWIVNSSALPIFKIYTLDFSSVLKKEPRSLYLKSIVTIFSIILIIFDTYGACYFLASRIIYFYTFFLLCVCLCVFVLHSKF